MSTADKADSSQRSAELAASQEHVYQKTDTPPSYGNFQKTIAVLWYIVNILSVNQIGQIIKHFSYFSVDGQSLNIQQNELQQASPRKNKKKGGNQAQKGRSSIFLVFEIY